MPHLIFQIDEILRLIAGYIGHASKPAAVEFARCCRAFEEPALRPLWEDTTLVNLMYVLPKDALYFGGPGIYVVCSLSRYPSAQLNPEATTRFRGSSVSSLRPNAGGYFDTHRGSEESPDS